MAVSVYCVCVSLASPVALLVACAVYFPLCGSLVFSALPTYSPGCWSNDVCAFVCTVIRIVYLSTVQYVQLQKGSAFINTFVVLRCV